METRVEVNGAAGSGERDENWLALAWRETRSGNWAAMTHISSQLSRVSSRASSLMPLKTLLADFRVSSSETLRKRFPLSSCQSCPWPRRGVGVLYPQGLEPL